MSFRRGTRPNAFSVSIVVWIAVAMTLPVAAMAEGPWIEVDRPIDGSVLTTKNVVVRGTAMPFNRTLALEGEDLASGTHTGCTWTEGNITFRPQVVFRDEFEGTTLNMDRWEILLDPANVSVEGGFLKLKYTWTWPVTQETLPMVRSKPFEAPEGVDYWSEYRLKFTGYSYTGSGGGISSGETDALRSHLAVYNMWATMAPTFRVLADGRALYNTTGYVFDFNTYTLLYSVDDDRYRVRMDGNPLGGFDKDESPSIFWFGPGEVGMYPSAAAIDVDYCEVWTQSAIWESDTYDLGHFGVLDDAVVSWDSSHPRDSEAELWVRASADGEDWSDWVPFEEGVPQDDLAGRFLQLRMRLAMDGVRRNGAKVTVSGVELGYHCPLTSVEVRREGGDWVTAQGLEEWSAALKLLEDGNVLEVRVTDSAGTQNLTSLEVTVDTTPPTGTMALEGDPQYTNDVNVTLLLTAEDRYGVEFVEVSNWPDFSNKRRFPMAERIPWTLLSVEDVNQVYVRFIDAHGLVSETVYDSVIYDPAPPFGSILIDGGKEYTSELTVALGLQASDNYRVVRIEVSNHADLADAREVKVGTTSIGDWELLEGEDGLRTVYMRLTDVTGNTKVVSDTIQLYVPKPLGALVINGGEAVTGYHVVKVEVQAPSDVRLRLMQLSNDPTFDGAEWEAVVKERMWVLPEDDGVHTVHLRFLDVRDIVSVPVNSSILLDTTPPEVEVTLNDGALYTTSTGVTGTVDYNDATQAVRMWVSLDDSFYRVPHQAFATGFNFTIPARESDHTVFVQLEDEAGNLGVGSGIIHYATHRPHIEVDLPEGKYTRALDRVPLNITPIDPYGGIEVQVSWGVDPGDDDPWTNLSGSGRVFAKVPPGTRDGRHTIKVRARNAPGLVSDVAGVEVVLDTAAPSISIVFPADGDVIAQRGKVVRLEVDVTDATRIVNLTYSIDGGEPVDFTKDQVRANMTMDGFGEHTVEVVAQDVAGNIARGTATFQLEDSEGAMTASAGLMMLLVLVVLGCAGAVAYGYTRQMRPGLRPAKVEEGDGWHDEWTAPHLVSGLEEVEGVTDGPGEAPQAPDETPDDAVAPLPPDELEAVDVPSEMEEVEAPSATSDWEEI